MRSGTRKVADSKPDATTSKDSKDGDTIPMNYIGTFGKVLNACIKFMASVVNDALCAWMTS